MSLEQGEQAGEDSALTGDRQKCSPKSTSPRSIRILRADRDPRNSQMAPTLPTELIQLIFEHLYDQVRSFEGYNADNLFGGNVAWFFTHLLTVSKTFRQLAWPFLVRDLIDARCRPKIWHTVARGKQQYLLEHVRSLEIPGDCALVEQIALLRKCSQLRSLLFTGGELDAAGLVPLPQVTTLSCDGTEGVDGVTWLNLLRSLPSLQHLSVSLHKPPRTFPAIDATFNDGKGWHLVSLQTREVHTLALPQLLAIMRDSAPTLKALSFLGPSKDREEDTVRAHSRRLPNGADVLKAFDTPLPVLRRLDLSHASLLPSSSSILCQSLLPALEHLEVTIEEDSVDYLLDISSTIKRVYLAVPDDLERSSAILASLVIFVAGHQQLELLSIDFMSSAIPEQEWYRDLEGLCARLGVVLASNDPRFGDSDGHKWYVGAPAHYYHSTLEDDEVHHHLWHEDVFDEYGESCTCEMCRESLEDDQSNQSSESVTTGVGSSGVAEVLDFDAEDDEMWAEQWSEEKRKAMGLGELFLAALRALLISSPATSRSTGEGTRSQGNKQRRVGRGQASCQR